MATEKRLIDANKLKEKAEPEVVTGEGIVYVQDIDEAPTVDAVEVVRCKDCQFAISDPFSKGCTKLVCIRTVNWRAVEQNHFCSYGERRTQ